MQSIQLVYMCHLCFWLSASLAVNDCSSQWTHRDLCLYEKLHHFQWLTLKPCMQVLRFHPTVWDHKLNNLAGAASEGIYKQRVCIYTGLLKLQCGKKRQNEKEQMRCSASCKIRQWIQRKWAEGVRLPLTFLLRILMSGAHFEPDNFVKDGAQTARSILP